MQIERFTLAIECLFGALFVIGVERRNRASDQIFVGIYKNGIQAMELVLNMMLFWRGGRGPKILNLATLKWDL